MIYGELTEIGKKAVFLSLEEFAAYRQLYGYSSTEENNKLADRIIQQWEKEVNL